MTVSLCCDALALSSLLDQVSTSICNGVGLCSKLEPASISKELIACTDQAAYKIPKKVPVTKKMPEQ